MRSGLLLFIIAVAGWATPAELAAQTERDFRATSLDRVAFELNYPKEKLHIHVLNPGYTPVGVEGCGKRAVYDGHNGVGYVETSESKE